MNKEVMVMPKAVKSEIFGIEIVPYLTFEQVELISTEMMKQKDYCSQQIVKDQYLLQFCVPNESFDGMEYNVLKACGFMDEVYFHVLNMDDIDKYIKHATSINYQVGELFEALIDLAKKAEKKMPKGAELKKILEKLQEVKK